MQLVGRFQDGVSAAVTDAVATLEGSGSGGTLVIWSETARRPLARWPAASLYAMPARRNELRIGASGQPVGARFVVLGQAAERLARDSLPALGERSRRDRGAEARLVAFSSLALVSVVAAYIYGIPLLAARIVGIMPPAWERSVGDTAAVQIEAALTDGAGFVVCDPDPKSPANRAIRRFTDMAVAGTGTLFVPEVVVVKADVANAFALPGGRIYYFSALIDTAENADEFAGVLAHELGHVVHRHGMEQFIATAGTGLLIGFILGDLTGISVAGGIGSALIDSRFSRDAEHQADRFAAAVAERAGFRPSALADLLERVAGDDSFSRALALLSTHPLTDDRRRELDQLAAGSTARAPAFSDAEWQAIKSMCSVP